MPDADITVYGAPWCPDCKRAKQFLGEQRVPYNWVDIDQDEEGRRYVQQANNGRQIIPTILFEDGSILIEPSNAEMAAKLGISPKAKREYYDLIIVGGGPAGLTAAIYAAREGIETLIIERSGVGGQAGTTERIENYPGFAHGVKGAELADAMKEQAERFEVEILPAQTVTSVLSRKQLYNERACRGSLEQRHAIQAAWGPRWTPPGIPRSRRSTPARSRNSPAALFSPSTP